MTESYSILELQDQYYVGVYSANVEYFSIGKHIGVAYSAVKDALEKHGIKNEIRSAPAVRFDNKKEKTIDIYAGFFVSEPEKVVHALEGALRLSKLPAGKYAKKVMVGGYEKLPMVWGEFMKELQGKNPCDPYEVYLSHNSEDSEKTVTELWCRLKLE